MTTVVIVVAIAVLALALIATVRLLLKPPSRTSQTLGQIGAYGFAEPSGGTVAGGSPGRPRTLAEAAASLGDALARKQSADRDEDIRRRLVAAGLYTQTPRAFFAAQALAAALLFLLWLVLGRLTGVATIVYLVGMPAALLGGWRLPSFLLSRRIAQRYHEIEKELPDLIDLLVVMVEAGVGFIGSMRLAAEQLEGPLGDELRLTLQEQNMGVSTEESLKGMARRADTPGVRAFVRAIVQGELLGVVDRADPAQPRERHAQEAEGEGRGTGPEGTHQDALPTRAAHLPRHVHRAPATRADHDQEHARQRTR